MSTIDIILIIPLVWGLIRGFMRGFIVEVASLIALVIGVYGAIHFSFYAESLLSANSSLEGNTLSIAAFGTTFILIVLGIHLGAKMLQKVISMAALGIVNRIVGAVFGFTKWMLIASFTLGFVNGLGGGSLGLIPYEVKQDSLIYPYLIQAGPTVLPILTDTGWFKIVEEYIPEI